MRTVTEKQLRHALAGLCDRFPMTEDERTAFIDHHIMAGLRGNIMQGLGNIEYLWVRRFQEGRVKFGARFTTVVETPAGLVVDAGGMLGMLAGKRGMELAVSKARAAGIGIVWLRNTTDWGAGGYCAIQALTHACLGYALANSRPEVAPYGGIDMIFGHSNYCVAIPARRHYPLLIDMAAVDCGGVKGQEDILTGRGLPAGVFIDENGNPVTDGSQWGSAGGYALPGGGQKMKSWKELCLVMSIEAMAGALSGMLCALDLNTPEDPANDVRTPKGQMAMAIHIAAFTPVEEFAEKIDRMIDQTKSGRRAPGFDEILVPGERGFRLAEKQAREGIAYPEQIWERARSAWRRAGLDLEALVKEAA
ncbi:MAG: putative oxidoreductase [Candidatus Aminicenantes bacterium]|nr:putative oxidoreductase [Candidatus Aminicenantes bacterium]